MRLIVQKYGGTSVGTLERIRNVARRLIETQREGCRVVAVISAMAGVTDELIKLAHEMSVVPPIDAFCTIMSTMMCAAAIFEKIRPAIPGSSRTPAMVSFA